MSGKHLKNKLDGFEMEVNEASVQKNWEQIKPLLTDRSVAGTRYFRFILASFIVLLPFCLLFLPGKKGAPEEQKINKAYVYSELKNAAKTEEQNEHLKSQGNRNIIRNTNTGNKEMTLLSRKKNTNKKKERFKAETVFAENNKVRSGNFTNDVQHKTTLKYTGLRLAGKKEQDKNEMPDADWRNERKETAQEPVKKDAPEYSEDVPPTIWSSSSQDVAKEEKQEQEEHQVTAYSNNRDTASVTGKDEKISFHEDKTQQLSIMYLPSKPIELLPCLLPEIYPVRLNVITSAGPGQKSNGRFYIDLLGGLHSSFATVRNKQENVSHKANNSDLSFGLTIGYHLKNRLSLNIQFGYDQEKDTVKEEYAQWIFVAKNLNYYQDGDTIYIVDTLTQYAKHKSNTSLAIQNAYNLSIGFAFNSIRLGRFNMEAAALINLRSTTYSFTHVSGLADSMAVISRTVEVKHIPPDYNEINPLLGQYASKKQIKSNTAYNLGIVPVLTLSYRVYDRVFFILRGSYALNASAVTRFYETHYKMKGNTAYVQLGIRFKF